MKTPRISGSGSSGFTIVETIIVLAILVILCSISAYALIHSHKTVSQNTLTDSIVSTLEQARSNAMAGKSGANFGVRFASSSYTYWSGNTYDPSDETNKTNDINRNFELSNTWSGSTGVVTFSRLSGIPQATGTITVFPISDPSHTQSITIGSQGEITVIR